MSYILTPNGRRPIVPINESAEQVNDTEMDIDFDVEHFLDYVMENFPELTEKYIEENYEQVNELSKGAVQDYKDSATYDKGLHDYKYQNSFGPSGVAKNRLRVKNREAGMKTADKKLSGTAKVSAKDDNAPGNHGRPLTMRSKKGTMGIGRD
jgi:hypothetical protein